MHELLHEAGLPYTEHAHHADFFLDHRSPPSDEDAPDRATLKETLRLILESSAAFSEKSGFAVPTGSGRSRERSIPMDARKSLTAFTRRSASAAFVSSAPVRSVLPVSAMLTGSPMLAASSSNRLIVAAAELSLAMAKGSRSADAVAKRIRYRARLLQPQLGGGTDQTVRRARDRKRTRINCRLHINSSAI